MDAAHIDLRKWPDRPHWQVPAQLLGRDEHGVWLHAPAGTVAARGEETTSFTIDLLAVVPRSAWWMVEFYREHPEWTVYVNIGTPCEWHGDRVTQIDLDLDVVRRHDGAVDVLDVDEFDDHRDRYGYPIELVEGALAATRAATRLLDDDAEPFGSAADRWWRVATP